MVKSGQPTALLAWELGAGLGHARRLLTIARALKDRGWAPVVAARELWACTGEYREAGIPLLQAPHHQGQVPKGVKFKARGYADIMAACGFAKAAALEAPLAGWDALLELIRPQVIVADYSPLLTLAAYGRFPLVAIGDGFVLPPPHLTRMPLLRQEGSGMPDEAVLLANAAAVQSRRGRAAPDSLPALVGGQHHVVCTYPETDIYAPFRKSPALGPISHPPRRLAPQTQPGVFAYLAADFGLTAKLLQAIVDTGLPVEAFVRDAPESLKQALRASRVHLHDRPPPLDLALSRANLIVHHGGIGTIEASLALGRPQVLLPRHLEQSLNAAALERIGVAVRVPPSFGLAEGSAIIRNAASSPTLAPRASDIAAELERRKPWPSLDRIVACCDAYRSERS